MDYTVSLDTTLASPRGSRRSSTPSSRPSPWSSSWCSSSSRGGGRPSSRSWRCCVSGGDVRPLPAVRLLHQHLSLFGLVLAIGLVVDDAIVVVEAVEHHIEHGMAPKEAALKAMEEVSGPVIASRSSSPPCSSRPPSSRDNGEAVPAVRRDDRRLGHPLGVQRPVLKPGAGGAAAEAEEEGDRPLQKFYDWFNRVFGRATNGYVSACDLAIRKSGMSLLFLVGVVVVTGLLGSRSPPASSPRRTRGTSSPACNCRTPPPCSAPTMSPGRPRRSS